MKVQQGYLKYSTTGSNVGLFVLIWMHYVLLIPSKGIQFNNSDLF